MSHKQGSKNSSEKEKRPEREHETQRQPEKEKKADMRPMDGDKTCIT